MPKEETKNKKTILIIDDTVKSTLKPFVEYLRLSDFAVEEAENIDKAFLLLQDPNKKIDLVILDIMLPAPEKDIAIEPELKTKYSTERRWGLWLLREINKLYPELKIIIYTVVKKNKLEEDLSKFNLHPENIKYHFYIEKPGDPEEIMGIISKTFRMKI